MYRFKCFIVIGHQTEDFVLSFDHVPCFILFSVAMGMLPGFPPPGMFPFWGPFPGAPPPPPAAPPASGPGADAPPGNAEASQAAGKVQPPQRSAGNS